MGRKKDIDKRKAAFTLFRKGTPLVDIAKEVGVTAPLISQWKKDDLWDDKVEESSINNENQDEGNRASIRF